MNYLTLSLRNVLRNPRRSLATALAVAFGYAAVNLFSGYIHNVYQGLGMQAVHGERLGHLTITRPDALQRGSLEPAQYLFAGDELQRLLSHLRADPEMERVALRLGLSGLISNGLVSTVFIGEGMAPADVAALAASVGPAGGGLLHPQRPLAAVATDLAAMLELGIDSYAVLVGATVHGQTNAVDTEVGALFNTGNAGTNDKFVLLPLELAQRLLDTDGADRLVLLLRDPARLDAVRARLGTELAAAGFAVDIHSWQELSSFYRQVRGLFDMIFVFIFAIVLVIVLLSIINTMSMAVLERTREIGTLRALGMRRRTVAGLFTLEGVLLVSLGGIGGLLLTLAARAGVNAMNWSYVPPNSSGAVPLWVDLVPAVLLLSFSLLALAAALAALLPARRAARMPVVDALGHV